MKKKVVVCIAMFASLLLVIITAEAMNEVTFASLGVALACSSYMEKHSAEFEQLADKFEKNFVECFRKYLNFK